MSQYGGPAMAASVMPITSHRNAICALATRSVANEMVTNLALYRCLPLRSCRFTRYDAPFRYHLGRGVAVARVGPTAQLAAYRALEEPCPTVLTCRRTPKAPIEQMRCGSWRVTGKPELIRPFVRSVPTNAHLARKTRADFNSAGPKPERSSPSPSRRTVHS